MKKIIWEKVMEVEPGVYFYGGNDESPLFRLGSTCTYRTSVSYAIPHWYAKICDYPGEPEMPRLDLKDGDPVMVRNGEDGPWLRRHFAAWSPSGGIRTWRRGTKWASEGVSIDWNYWRLPSKEKLEEA